MWFLKLNIWINARQLVLLTLSYFETYVARCLKIGALIRILAFMLQDSELKKDACSSTG